MLSEARPKHNRFRPKGVRSFPDPSSLEGCAKIAKATLARRARDCSQGIHPLVPVPPNHPRPEGERLGGPPPLEVGEPMTTLRRYQEFIIESPMSEGHGPPGESSPPGGRTKHSFTRHANHPSVLAPVGRNIRSSNKFVHPPGEISHSPPTGG